MRLSRSFQAQTFSKYLWKIIISIAAIIIILIASYNKFAPLNSARSYLRDGIAPVIGFFQSFTRSSSKIIEKGNDFLISYQKLNQLQKENNELKRWKYAALALMSENKALRKQVSALPEERLQPILTARLLTHPGVTGTQRAIIQGGKKNGIDIGQPVITPEGLIGRVSEVGRNASEILMITDDRSRIPVIIEPSHHQAILSGYQGQYLILQHLEKEANIKPGVSVFTSGKGGQFPSGLFIGTVQMHNSKLIVQPLSNWKNIEYVQILVQPKIDMDE